MMRRFAAAPFLLLISAAAAQELPLSGTEGYSIMYATTPGGASQCCAVTLDQIGAPIPLGAPVAAVPSRWAHRRRTLGALETAIAFAPPLAFITPMGTTAGTGALHLVDARAGAPILTALAPGGNPAAYDLAIHGALHYVFSAEDGGAGTTVVRGYSWATPGVLAPLTPPSISIIGRPCAYVNRIGVDEAGNLLHVPTETGVQIINVSASAPQMSAGAFLSTSPAVATTNPASFVRGGQTTWILGTSKFSGGGATTEAGYFAWTAAGAVGSGSFGAVPSSPSKKWVPAAGAEEAAIVGDGANTYAYYLLREPGINTFFVKGAAVGVVKFLGAAAPAVSFVPCPDAAGEPFGIPAASAGRVAFESSFGPPFDTSLAGGGERICIIYSPLDALGAASSDGVLAIPAPLGGRISNKGMDRPIWSRDGLRVFAATSHFPGAPNPGVPGLESLDVPPDVPLTPFQSPHTIVVNNPFPNQSITLPSIFAPRTPAAAGGLDAYTFYGNVFNQGAASLFAGGFGEIGQIQIEPNPFTQSPSIPDFRALLKPVFNDTVSPTTPIPPSFGARRTSFNLHPDAGVFGLVMAAAQDSEILLQPTGYNIYAALGFALPLPAFHVPLPAGSITTTEILSL